MHNQFLLAALEQAWLGRGICSPNPAVGAVATQHGIIIAQASHSGAGTAHAEHLLLTQLPQSMPAVTLYVTLEPCNHWGKTPPCVDAIIQYGIERVVYGYRDPNPLVAVNDTTAILNQHGIDVVYHPMPEIEQFYQSYRHWTLTGKPWVTAKIAQTFDGKIAGALGARVQLSNAQCALFTHQQRLKTDIILTTARTVIADDPQLNARMPEVSVAKPVAILDRNLTIEAEAQVLQLAAHCHIFHDSAHTVHHPHPRCTYHAVPLQEDGLDLSYVIHRLGGLGYQDIWVEAGGELFCALHKEKLVNRTHVYLVPKLLGHDATALCHHEDIFDKACSIVWLAKGDNMIASLDWQEDTCLLA